MKQVHLALGFIGGGTPEERLFLEEVVLPAAAEYLSAEEALQRWGAWAARTNLLVDPTHRLRKLLIEALRRLQLDKALTGSPAHHLLHQAYGLLFTLKGEAWRRDADIRLSGLKDQQPELQAH